MCDTTEWLIHVHVTGGKLRWNMHGATLNIKTMCQTSQGLESSRFPAHTERRGPREACSSLARPKTLRTGHRNKEMVLYMPQLYV